MPRRTHLLGGAAAAATVLLAAPAGAFALTGAVDMPCYTHVPTGGSTPVTVTLNGGTPGAPYTVAATIPGKGEGSAGSASGDFDAAGNATAQITDVSVPSGTIGPTKGQQVAISAKDFGAGAVATPIANATITNLALSVATKPVSPRAHRTVSVSGVPFAGQSIYGFIVKPGSSKVLRKFSLGKANACGFASRKSVVAPRAVKYGSYRLYVNAGSSLNKDKAISSAFRIFRRFR